MLLKELVESKMISLGRGQIISKDEINKFPGDYPVYSSSASETGEFGRYGKYMFDDERITWSIDGGGKMFYRNNHKYSVTNVCGWLKVDTPKLLTKYVYYCLFYQWSFRQFDYQYKAHPSVIKEIYDIPIIDVAKQKVIVKTLDKINKQILCEKESLPFLNSLIKSRFNEQFIGNPSFPTKKWHEVLNIINGRDYKGHEGTQYPIYGSGGFMGIYANNFLASGILTIIGRKGTIDRPLLVNGEIWNIDTAFAIKTNDEILNPVFFHYRSNFYDYQSLNKQTTKPSLRKSDLLKLDIEIPPMRQQLEFIKLVEVIDKLKFNCQQRIKLYQELLDKKMDEYFG